MNLAGSATVDARKVGGNVQAKPLRHTLKQNLIVLSFLADFAVLCGAMFLAYWLRFETALRYFGVVDERIVLQHYLGHLAIGVITLSVVLANFRLYDPKHLLSFRDTARIIVKSCGLWVVGYLAFSLVLKFNPPISRLYCVLGFANAAALLVGWRWMLYRILRREEYANLLQMRVVFVGWNADCMRAMRRMGDFASRTIAVHGIVRPPNGVLEAEPPAGVRVLGDFEDCRRVVEAGEVDTVLVTDLDMSRGELIELANFCEKEMIEFKLVPTCFQVLLSGLHLETVSGMPVLGISRLPLHSTFNNYLKRGVDVVGSVVALVLSAPVMAFFGALIYLESPGPIFYRQRRLGRNGELFDIFKLRSMKLDAESNGKPGWTVRDDPRVLRIGKFMRSWNIDEIPQFWNVLRGEMSLVGPRPERPELIETFKEEIPHYNARHNIKPGITGWAQVNGFRGDTDLSERVRFDLDYIERWNLFFDFQIMLLTFCQRENAC